ncbi:uncharacterized protein BO72DRAFT_138576 [Aspergillus fijiensis CBS 313.89]|uniref:Secreted protein n=1 Tax=Aspergillus fijiensis CBS 313.89 TaxID=1448319 RepID=A0A8G1RZL3_9EURO|nr:uncharacterized protein BO72DRAFT_138576 [Aspergillus fijiensis CBS 313.89]RAK82074.1 hypothetical protein BO72DRAFT_138576 [Aspergillus fijiensis CBS 313.89]
MVVLVLVLVLGVGVCVCVSDSCYEVTCVVPPPLCKVQCNCWAYSLASLQRAPHASSLVMNPNPATGSLVSISKSKQAKYAS